MVNFCSNLEKYKNFECGMLTNGCNYKSIGNLKAIGNSLYVDKQNNSEIKKRSKL